MSRKVGYDRRVISHIELPRARELFIHYFINSSGGRNPKSSCVYSRVGFRVAFHVALNSKQETPFT